MSLAKIYSGAVYGVDAYPVEIEVNAGGGEPMMILVGLPDAAVRESKDRVWTAIINSGFWPPEGRTTVNLAPADIKKEGPSFDLPIALGMLAANKDIAKEALEGVCAVGELALSPSINSGQADRCAECAVYCRWRCRRGGKDGGCCWCRRRTRKRRPWSRD
jgi:magnesium chelatase family protein